MKVSVIIPTYNRAHVICEALDSVLAQTYEDFEVIIVDDGSTDDTAEKIEPYLSDGRVRYVKQENAGVSAARNFGVSLATAKVISFIDSDDLWKPEKLEREVSFFKKHRDVKVVFSDLEAQRGDVFIPSFMRETPFFSKMIKDLSYGEAIVVSQRNMFLILLKEVPVKPTAFSIYKGLFKNTGGFDPSYVSGEDWEFFLRLSKSEKFGYINQPLAVLRLSKDSLHKLHVKKDILGVLGFLTDIKRSLSNDPEAQKAVRNGMKDVYVRLCKYYHYEEKMRFLAVKTCLNGYLKTRDAELLLRAVEINLPEVIKVKSRQFLRRLVNV